MAMKGNVGSKYIRSSAPQSRQSLERSFRASMQDILAGFDEFMEDIETNSAEILTDAMEETFGKALTYCPEDSGELRDSGYLEVQSFRGKHVCAIGFGKGNKPDYAIYVHEMPYQHEAPTRSKFLQAALDEDYYSILNKVAEGYRAITK